MPALGSVKGFELRLQSNLARVNSYIYNYPAIPTTGASVTLLSIVSNQSIGHCCPVMVVSNITGDGTTGLNYVAPGTEIATGLVSITTRCSIGWYNNANVTANAPACRLYIPMVSYTSEYMKDIIANPIYSLKYNDYYIDIDEKKQQNTTITKLFNSTVSKARILYIIPFLSSQPVTVYDSATPPAVVTRAYTSAVLSPLSSAPNTATPCRLKILILLLEAVNRSLVSHKCIIIVFIIQMQ